MKEIYQTLSQSGQFFNPVQILSGAIGYGIAALLLVLLLLIIFRKRVLVPRRYPALRLLAYSYFVLLPLLAGFFWLKWGFFHSLRKDIKAHTEVYIQHIPASYDANTSAAVRTFLHENKVSLSTLTTDQLIDAVTNIIYTQYNTVLSQEASLKSSSNMLLSWALKFTKGQGLSQFVKRTIHDTVKEKFGLEQSITKELMASHIDEVLRTGLFAKIALIQADHFLKRIQKGILITFCILMAIPLLEIGIAHYLHKKKKAVPASTPAVTPV